MPAKRVSKKPRKAAAADMLHVGDNLPFMQSLPDGCCDLIYLDPPFSTGKPQRREGIGYDDTWVGGIKAYLAFMFPRLEQCRRLLSDHGTLYLHLDWRASHYARVQLDTLFGVDHFLNEIIWHYRSGSAAKRWFGRKHDTILSYARCVGQHRFHVIREGTFRTDGLKVDEEGRLYKSTKKGRLYFNAAGPALSDVWDLPFLSTVSLERTGWPSQKPLALLERIINASSEPGDCVADFFCGSGTTAMAAKKLGRRWIACDASSKAVEIARRRLGLAT